MEKEIETVDAQEEEVNEEEAEEAAESGENEDEESELERLKKENKTLLEQKKHWREKAEKPKEKEEAAEEKAQSDDISYRDFMVLSNNGVTHEDDVDYIIGQSKALGKSISDTVKDEDIQTVLNNRKQKRETADASNTKKARGGNKQLTGSQINAKVLKEGTPPDPTDQEAQEALFWERRGGKPKAN